MVANIKGSNRSQCRNRVEQFEKPNVCEHRRPFGIRPWHVIGVKQSRFSINERREREHRLHRVTV